MFTQRTLTQPSTSHSTLRRLVARYPITAFLILAFACSWMSLIPLILSQGAKFEQTPPAVEQLQSVLPEHKWFVYQRSRIVGCWCYHSSEWTDKTQHFFSNILSRIFAIVAESRRIPEWKRRMCAVVKWRSPSLTRGDDARNAAGKLGR